MGGDMGGPRFVDGAVLALRHAVLEQSSSVGCAGTSSLVGGSILPEKKQA
jgi:hypothetical protein